MRLPDHAGPLHVSGLLSFALLLLWFALVGQRLLQLFGDVEGIEMRFCPHHRLIWRRFTFTELGWPLATYSKPSTLWKDSISKTKSRTPASPPILNMHHIDEHTVFIWLLHRSDWSHKIKTAVWCQQDFIISQVEPTLYRESGLGLLRIPRSCLSCPRVLMPDQLSFWPTGSSREVTGL